MATIVMSRNTTLVRHMRSFSSLLMRVRAMSSAEGGDSHTYHEKGDVASTNDNVHPFLSWLSWRSLGGPPVSVNPQGGGHPSCSGANGASRGKTWPDAELRTLDPYDHLRFPLPGDSAPAFGSHSAAVAEGLSPPVPMESDILAEPTRMEQQALIYTQFNPEHAQMPKSGSTPELKQNRLELRVQDCPNLMRRDFQDLFPGSSVMTGDFTVLSVCQRTDNDMTSWSPDVDEEREKLLDLYVDTAQEVCNVLKNAGFWADFIDPCSGKPYNGPHTTATMFETDERYRHFGFDIEDLGCCKVIKHHIWGTKSYVGCIFTNAPNVHPLLMEIAAAEVC